MLATETLSAVDRLVASLQEPSLQAVLAPLIQREIIARLLVSKNGAQLLHFNASDSSYRQIAQVMAWLKQHFSEPVNVDELAQKAYMSPSTFRQHFKAVSGTTPLNYLKQIRLQEARQLMLNDNLEAGAAGLRVGYESVSQFRREYARLFGAPPKRDIERCREKL